MKKVLLTLLFGTYIFAASGMQWLTLKEAQEVSKLTYRPYFVMVVKDGCPYCEQEKRAMESDKKFQKLINDNMIPVLINQDHETVPDIFFTSATPTIFIYDNKQDRLVVKPAYGAIPTDKLKPWIQNVLFMWSRQFKW